MDCFQSASAAASSTAASFEPKRDSRKGTSELSESLVVLDNAAMRGSDYLVIGRPITRADDPAEAARRIGMELTNAG